MIDCSKIQTLLPNVTHIHPVGSYITGPTRRSRLTIDLVALTSVALTPIYFEAAEIILKKAYF